MPPRSIRAETRAAVLCAILGVNIDPDLVFWTFRVVDVLSYALAGLAAYLVLRLALDGLTEAAEGIVRRERGGDRKSKSQDKSLKGYAEQGAA